MRVKTKAIIVLAVFVVALAGLLLVDESRIKYPDVPDLLTNVPAFVPAPVDGFPEYLVPNVIHMVHFGGSDLTFHEVVSLRAAHLNHGPDRIYLHCDCRQLEGKYWNMVKGIPGLELKFKEPPTHVFGKELSNIYHKSDVARLEIMMEHGGIYIDTDVYIVSSLDEYRKYEFAIGWDHGQFLGTQVLVGNRNARFLRLWYDSYRYYVPRAWYYNAGELPTKHILRRMPGLVKRVSHSFGEDYSMKEMMYEEDTDEWRTYKTIHYLIRHAVYTSSPVTEFDEENIKTYQRTFGAMARLVLYGQTDVIQATTTVSTV